MKYVAIFIIASLFWVKSDAISLKPSPNSSHQTDSLLLTKFPANYSIIIGYTQESYWWANRKYYVLLALDGEQWWKITLSSKSNKKGKFKQPKITKEKFDNKLALSLLEKLNSYGFWAMNNDSLNYTEQRNNQGKMRRHSISDATNYRFELWKDKQWRTIECYAPEYFLERMPEIQMRARFINCRNAFIQAAKGS